MKGAEVIIIGGGVAGASVAWHLAERGVKDILILESEQQQGLGSTGKATGGVRAQFETEINIRLSLYSLDLFSLFSELTGVDCGYEPRGYLFLATSEQQLEYLRNNVSRQRSLGLKEVEIVDRQTIGEMVDGLNVSDIVGGSFCSRDGFIDPLAVMSGFTKKAVEHGAKVSTGIKVTRIETENGKVSALQTDKGQISADKVVCCAGAWSKELAATAGIDLPITPLRRQIIWAKSAAELPANLPMVIDLGNGFHFRPAKGSRHELLFAYPDPDEPPGYETIFDPAFIEKVLPKARHRAPFLTDAEIVHEKCRAGLYEMTPDHHAILGGCEIEGLYFAGGFSGHGVMHSPATGRALAEIMLDGKASFLDVSCLGLNRFKENKLLLETAFI
ncbi:MAG TPA: FAD-dependent oxidoreductase [Pyrinomonadaceae bacterium]|jgi:sarcosine oxidase subunit beta|nr:FAD-dependent oxidoreductase [Pyrinomonadaceae bacterium]